MSEERDVYSARLRAGDRKYGFPFLSYALESIVPIITKNIPTAAVDKYWRCYVNPDFFAKLTLDEGAMVMVHEVWHLLLDHAERRENYDVPPEEIPLWLQSVEPEVNAHDAIYKRLPRGDKLYGGEPVTYKTLKVEEGLLAEEVFEILRKRPRPKVQVIAIAMPGSGKCGSCSGDNPQDYELPAPTHTTGDGKASKGSGKGKNYIPGISKTRAKIIQEATAQEIIEASKSRGDVPGNWLRWAEKRLKPKVDYRRYLRRTVQGVIFSKTGTTWPDYRRPARRQHMREFISPSYRDLIPQVALIIDTSGSMSDDQVCQGVAEVDGVLRTLAKRCEVTVYFTDACAAPAQKVSSATQLRPIGGGGTDMGAGFEAIDEAAAKYPLSRPNTIIVITDGYTPWPENPPSYANVIIVLVGGGESAPWASPPKHHTVKLNTEEMADAN